ncbi:DUF397 domain-containing protein [Streptosporangium sp. NPDC048865]|uniref:DUF397 domain-containing protein n=1 Tax=Streptosporangium sp. NPDC048865 TaxID=3155766 RepID=UPI00344775DF
MSANNHNDVIWKKSALSAASGNCVEVARLGEGRVGVRDSKDSSGPVLTFASGAWNSFVGGVKGGEFDV